jgi:hypothetical protein
MQENLMSNNPKGHNQYTKNRGAEHRSSTSTPTEANNVRQQSGFGKESDRMKEQSSTKGSH